MPDSKLPIGQQLEQALRKLIERNRVMNDQSSKIHDMESRIDDLQSRLRDAQRLLQDKDASLAMFKVESIKGSLDRLGGGMARLYIFHSHRYQ
jgi:uncharacterized protein Yka (UPF0111/DUF47 family)